MLYSKTPGTSSAQYWLYLKFTAAAASQLSFDYAVVAENASKLILTLNDGTEDVRQEVYGSSSGEHVKWYVPAGAYTLSAEFRQASGAGSAAADYYASLRNLRLDSLAPFLHVREHRVSGGALVQVRRQTAAELVRMADGTTLEERLGALAERVAALRNGGDAE